MRQAIAIIGLIAGILCLPVSAQEAPPAFPEFSAKRVKPPAPGATRRITVQITEQAPEVVPVLPQDIATGETAAVSLYGWFWDALAPSSTTLGPGRISDALDILATPSAKEALPAPRLQELQSIVDGFGLDIMLATIGTDVSPALVLSVIYVESRGRVEAKSAAGAQGLMQLIPATAERFNVSDAFNGAENIKGGAAYLNWLMGEFDQDPILALAAYNSGENAVRQNKGVPPFAETLNYVPRVLTAFSVAKGLCLTPPLFASDGCVFAKLSN